VRRSYVVCEAAANAPFGLLRMPERRLIEDEAERTAQDQAAECGALGIAREACALCLQRRNLRRTLPIALVVGVVLTLINQGGVLAAGHATTGTWVRCALNFVVPFLVSNAGLLSGRR
jgi:hypothetical protein